MTEPLGDSSSTLEIQGSLEENPDLEHRRYWEDRYFKEISATYDTQLTPEQESRVRTLAIEYTNQRLELEERAEFDQLTRLRYLQSYEEQVALHLSDMAREAKVGKPVEAIMLAFDIDNLKEWNDSKGHPAGDKLIEAYARVVKKCTRPFDIKGRLGGDEMGVFLRGVSLDVASEIAERIRLGIIEEIKTVFEDPTLERTVSIGVAQYTPGDTVHSLRKRSDLAANKAKQSGKNRTIIYNSDMELARTT